MIGLNVVDYLLITLIAIFIYMVYIKTLKFLKQSERKEGLKSHKFKEGTITMGGIIFVILPSFFIEYDTDVKFIYFTFLTFMIIGLIDDLLIILFKRNDGLNPYIKLILEILISGVIFYFYLNKDLSTKIFNLDLKWGFGLLILLVLTGATNAWNLLDGVDGLCSGCSLIIGITVMLICYKLNEYSILNMLILIHLVLFIFWCLNLPKAYIFMGDTGSLALGAIYSIIFIYLDLLIPFIIMSLLFIFDTLSVILQVIYYKRTKGKRLFKMAPYHHHLEMCGFSEMKVDLLFYSIQILLCFIGYKIIF